MTVKWASPWFRLMERVLIYKLFSPASHLLGGALLFCVPVGTLDVRAARGIPSISFSSDKLWFAFLLGFLLLL